VPIVPPTLPAAIRLANALKKSKLDEKGLAFASDPQLFHVRVAPANIDRAVAIVEALLVAVADRGYAATAGSEHMTLVVDGETAIVSLKEATKRVEHVETQEEADREARRSQAAARKNWDLYTRLHQPRPRWDYKHAGLLTPRDRQCRLPRCPQALVRYAASKAGDDAQRRAGGVCGLRGSAQARPRRTR
jgi:hypothetical protein